MAENLETKSRKAVLSIKGKVADIENLLRDISSKLCYLVRSKGRHYNISEGIDYEGSYE